jgi:hypothetical protein
MLFKMRMIIALAAALFSSSLCFAQWQLDTVEHKNIIKFDAFQALVMEDYLLAYERVVAPNASVVLTAGYLGGYWDQENTLANGNIDRSYYVRNGFYIAPEFRFYLTEFTNERRPSGAYVGAYPIVEMSWVNRRGDNRPTRGSGIFDAPVAWGPPYRANLDIQEHYYGLGTAIGMQLFVFHGIMFEAQLNASIGFRDFEQVGFETNGFGEWQPANRRQFNHDSRFAARFFLGYAF